MWILLQVGGCLAVVVTNSIGRSCGLSNWAATAVAAAIYFGGWACFQLSYKQAPSFMHAYVLGSCVLAILGAVVALMFFKESLGVAKVLGLALMIAGAVLVSKV